MTNKFYPDTDTRMVGDTEFRYAVYTMMQMADRHGFTPGDLKQIAFRAALELEMRRPGTWVLTQGQLRELEESAERRIDPRELALLLEAVRLPPPPPESK